MVVNQEDVPDVNLVNVGRNVDVREGDLVVSQGGGGGGASALVRNVELVKFVLEEGR